MKKVKVNKNGVKKIIAAVAVLLAVAVLCYEISNFNSSNVKTQPAAAPKPSMRPRVFSSARVIAASVK